MITDTACDLYKHLIPFINRQLLIAISNGANKRNDVIDLLVSIGFIQ